MQKIQLSIPEPCHENWQAMTPTEQGRFCSFCSKEVIDFSMMTDTEVLHYFTNRNNEKICGRVLESQLNRPVTMPKTPKKRLFWYWNYIAMFFMFFLSAGRSNAQTKGQIQTTPTKPKLPRGTQGLTNKDSMVVPTAPKKDQHIKILGGVCTIAEYLGPLYLLDGEIVNNPDTINMDNIVNIEVLKGPSAIAIYGYRANEGVVSMTSKKAAQARTKNLDTVTVKGYPPQRKESIMMGGLISGVTIKSTKEQKKQAALEAVALSAVVFPNPVKRGTDFTLQLQGNETGAYSFIITNPAGQIVLQRQGLITQPLQNESILCVNSWAAGIYYVVVRDGRGQITQNSSFIVQ